MAAGAVIAAFSYLEAGTPGSACAVVEADRSRTVLGIRRDRRPPGGPFTRLAIQAYMVRRAAVAIGLCRGNR
jgi:hypothetical protein